MPDPRYLNGPANITVLVTLSPSLGRSGPADPPSVEALIADSDHVAVLPRFTTPHGSGVVLRPLTGLAIGRHVFAILRPDRAERRAVQRVLDAFIRLGAGFAGE